MPRFAKNLDGTVSFCHTTPMDKRFQQLGLNPPPPPPPPMATPAPMAGTILSPRDTRDVADLISPYVELAVETLANTCRYGKSEAAKVTAANTILERRYGKVATAAIEVGEGPSKIRVEFV